MDYGPWQWWRHAETGIERFWVWMAEHPALERLWLQYHSRCVACVVTVITWVQYIKLHSNMKTMWMIRLTNEQHTTLYKLSTFCFLCILCIIVMNPVLCFISEIDRYLLGVVRSIRQHSGHMEHDFTVVKGGVHRLLTSGVSWRINSNQSVL